MSKIAQHEYLDSVTDNERTVPVKRYVYVPAAWEVWVKKGDADWRVHWVYGTEEGASRAAEMMIIHYPWEVKIRPLYRKELKK